MAKAAPTTPESTAAFERTAAGRASTPPVLCAATSRRLSSVTQISARTICFHDHGLTHYLMKLRREESREHAARFERIARLLPNIGARSSHRRRFVR